jgi:hypothetical protein
VLVATRRRVVDVVFGECNSRPLYACLFWVVNRNYQIPSTDTGATTEFHPATKYLLSILLVSNMVSCSFRKIQWENVALSSLHCCSFEARNQLDCLRRCSFCGNLAIRVLAKNPTQLFNDQVQMQTQAPPHYVLSRKVSPLPFRISSSTANMPRAPQSPTWSKNDEPERAPAGRATPLLNMWIRVSQYELPRTGQLKNKQHMRV